MEKGKKHATTATEKTGTKVVTPEIIELKETIDELQTRLKGIEIDSPIPSEIIDCLVHLVHVSRSIFEPYNVLLDLEERKKLFGSGTKSYGFIEKACASAADNQQLLPSYLSIEDFQNHYGDVYRKRTLLQQIRLYEQQVDDSFLASADEAYHDALNYYNSLKDAARRNVPDARELYDELRPYFIHKKQGDIPPPPNTESGNR